MARNKKIDTNKNKQKESDKVALRLDAETLLIYNRVKKYTNMSKWFRDQLWFHFAKDGLTPQQKNQRLREEMAIAAQKKKKAMDLAEKEYFDTVQKIQRSMSNEEISVVVGELQE